MLPDLTAAVHRWSASGDVLFIEMTFTATVGVRRLSWSGVDRFVFHDDRAVERIAYFDPAHLWAACLRHPKGWRQAWRFVRRRL